MIDAPSLRESAHRLLIDASWLTHQHDWLRDHVDRLPRSGFRGAAADAAVRRLHLLAAPFGTPPEQMLRVAEVLQVTAGLQEELDAAAHRALLLAEDHARSSPLVAMFLRDLRHLGDLLDWTCARQIELLCTPLPDEPPTRLADTPDLPIGAVHELNLIRSDLTLPPDVQLLEVGEHQRVVLAVGDLATADSVTTVVAGVGSSHPDALPGQLERARTLARVTGGATVLWLGYPAPATVPAALAQEPARAAGGELRRFQRELARRFPDQRRLVVGYSYGSVVVGEASRSEGLHADHVMLLGSPGAGIDSAADLRLIGNDPEVHAMTNPGDPIALVSGVHGTSPTAPEFGARVWPGDREGTHSSYWDDPLLLGILRDLAQDQKNPSALSE